MEVTASCILNFFEKFWEWRLMNSPEFATSIGVHKYDDRLDEMSLNSYSRRHDEGKVFLEELNSLVVLVEKSSEKTLQTNLELLKGDLEQYLVGMSFRSYLWPLNQLEGPQSDFPRLLSYMRKKCPEDLQKIIERMRKFPQQIDETIQLLNEGIRIGMIMHKLSVEPVVKILNDLNSNNIEDSLFSDLFKGNSEIDLDVWKNFANDGKYLIQNDVLLAYKKLQEYLLSKYIPKTRADVAISSVLNGRDLYNACLKFHTTTDKTPEEIHNLGKAEVERITKLMEDVMKEINFKGTFEEFRKFVKNDPQFRFSSAVEIENHYKKLGVEIREILPTYFARMPKANYIVTRIPEDSAPTMPGAYYLAPPEDESRPGTFFINTYKPETKLKYEAVSLCLHEAEPGHHLQSALTMESGALVNFRRFLEDRKYYEVPSRFAMNTGYVEGWGLYSEFLGEEMGLYKNPYDLFGRLSHEMLRACRLVVDTGLHALGWSREEAIEYMSKHTATDAHNIASEIDRYITWPGQACAYKVGEIKLKELRKLAINQLGKNFDVKKFHDLIASMGGVPLYILEKQILLFIESNKD